MAFLSCNVTTLWCDSSGSGGTRKGAQHQASSGVTGHLYRANRSESLDRSHVSATNNISRQHQPRVMVGHDGPLPSSVSPNLSDGRRNAAAIDSRLSAVKSG